MTRKPIINPRTYDWPLNDANIKRMAISAGCPDGWVEGPWFDEAGLLRAGMPECLRYFAYEITQALMLYWDCGPAGARAKAVPPHKPNARHIKKGRPPTEADERP